MTHLIELDPITEQRLEELVARTGRSKSEHLRDFIAEALEDLEDVRIAEERYADILAGKEQTVSLEEVMKSYGMGS